MLVFIAKDIPAVGYKVFYTKDAKVNDAKSVAFSGAVENDNFKVVLDSSAELTSIFDKKNNREVLSGKGNVFRLYEDLPGKYDAWDIVASYVDREFDTEAGKVTGITTGDVFTVVSIEKNINKSH